MEKELTDLFIEKRYHELSGDEKDQLSDLCSSEEEFEQMRNVFTGIHMVKTEAFQTKKETKESLDALFSSVHAPQRNIHWLTSAWILIYPENKPFVRKPLVQMAAIGLIVLLTVPFLIQDKIVDQKVITAELEPKESVQGTSVTPTESATGSTALSSGVDSRSQNPVARTYVSTRGAEDYTLVADQLFASEMAVGQAGATAHPDGEFIGVEATFSCSAQQQPGVLDLITAVF